MVWRSCPAPSVLRPGYPRTPWRARHQGAVPPELAHVSLSRAILGPWPERPPLPPQARHGLPASRRRLSQGPVPNTTAGPHPPSPVPSDGASLLGGRRPRPDPRPRLPPFLQGQGSHAADTPLSAARFDLWTRDPGARRGSRCTGPGRARVPHSRPRRLRRDPDGNLRELTARMRRPRAPPPARAAGPRARVPVPSLARPGPERGREPRTRWKTG